MKHFFILSSVIFLAWTILLGLCYKIEIFRNKFFEMIGGPDGTASVTRVIRIGWWFISGTCIVYAITTTTKIDNAILIFMGVCQGFSEIAGVLNKKLELTNVKDSSNDNQ